MTPQPRRGLRMSTGPQEASPTCSTAGTSCSPAARGIGCGTTRRYARRFARICRRSSPARTSSMTARAPCACPCACSSIIASGCCRPARVRESARERPNRATCSGQANPTSGPGQKGAGGKDHGGIELMLEFKVDDIIDWLWEELKLPNLQPRAGATEESEWKREGWDRRGARSRLDRRRSLKESVKRRALDEDSPAFTDEDLRYRQLTRRRQPALRAAVFFLLDVSGQHVRSRPAARQDVFLLGRRRAAARVQGARHRVRRPHHRGVGVQRGGFLQGHRQRRHGRLGGTRQSARDHARALRSRVLQRLPVLCLGRRQRVRRSHAGEYGARGAREGGALCRLSGDFSRRAQHAERDHEPVRRRRRGGTAVRPILVAGPDDVAGAVRHFFTAEAQSGEADAAGIPP